ncbi:osmolarity response regulator [Alteromonadales bacterium TW-7]|nr:osmolarity response regulator [Alteromonadales bacterium TW-7]
MGTVINLEKFVELKVFKAAIIVV